MHVVEVGQYFVTKDTGDLDNFNQWLVANTPFHEMIELLNQKGGSKEMWELDLYWKSRLVISALQVRNWNSNQVREPRRFSFLGQNFLWNGQIRDRFYWRQYRNSCRSTRRANSTNKHECGCSQVKGKSKTSTERTCWDNSNHTNTPKKMDWHWTIKTRSWLVRSLEESH